MTLAEAVDWPAGSKIVITTTDFESPYSSHSEVATVAGLTEGGTRVALRDIRGCRTYLDSGIPTDCTLGQTLLHHHISEVVRTPQSLVLYCRTNNEPRASHTPPRALSQPTLSPSPASGTLRMCANPEAV